MPVFDGCTCNFVGLIMHMLIYLSDFSLSENRLYVNKGQELRIVSVTLTVILLPTLGYSLCLLNVGINPNKILILGKNISKIWKIQALFGLGSSLYSAVK